ncbi:MAG: hypothetical protein LBN20_00275 [Endomicrobium sp.]|jgi:hypothetical protein|nr:hypothetical protein [Endomicrobium sp.]
MKKIIFVCLALCFTFTISAFGDYVKGIDYNANYKKKSADMADTLHIEFITTRPPAATAERIVQEQLREYGRKSSGKNIIGSAWFSVSGAEGPFSKIRFSDNLASYVWINRTGRVVSFSTYMSWLKQDRDRRRAAARKKAST